MAENFKTKYISNYYCCIVIFCTVFTAEPKTYSNKFYKAANPNYVILNAVTSERATSNIECAMNCVNQKCSCYSFSKLQERCDVGTCKRSNTSTGTSDEIYVQCNTKAGFKIVTSGSLTACIWVSTNAVNYFAAREDCYYNKAASLYTVRTKDKLRLLKENFSGSGTNFWIGLTDNDEEGVYRWDDDSTTICNATCIDQIFEGSPPNNGYNTEDCVVFDWTNVLNDITWSDPSRYICEQPFFNWP